MIKSITGCRVQLVGKPSLDSLRCAASRLGVPLRDVAVVGDDPDLEVPMAHRGGALAIAVSTGVGAADSFGHLPAAEEAPFRGLPKNAKRANYVQATPGPLPCSRLGRR